MGMQINPRFNVEKIEKELNINIKQQNLNKVKDFVYLGGNISGDTSIVRAGWLKKDQLYLRS